MLDDLLQQELCALEKRQGELETEFKKQEKIWAEQKVIITPSSVVRAMCFVGDVKTWCNLLV